MTNFDEQLAHLPGDILLALALNESADPRGRKAAVEIMYHHNYPQVRHKDLQGLLAEVLADTEARQEVIDIVESAIEQPLAAGPSPAGVTTANLASAATRSPEPTGKQTNGTA